MPAITAILAYEKDDATGALLNELASSAVVERIALIRGSEGEPEDFPPSIRSKLILLEGEFFSASLVNRVLDEARTDYVLVVFPSERIRLAQRALERLLAEAADSGAGLVYCDFRDDFSGDLTDHPLIDCQAGSIRDSFDFGSMILISSRAAAKAYKESGRPDEKLRFAGWYDLRLKLSVNSLVLRIPEPLYTRIPSDRRTSGERQFDYVDPRRRDYQLEMEHAVTAHLKRIDAHLAPEFQIPPRTEDRFPVHASVVIPVRNRERTIKDAVISALSQKSRFEFNVIAVDNHSTDRTSEILGEIARRDTRLVHLKPSRTDLGIGGCWNEAIYSRQCGQYAVQLDSDDLYSSEETLATIVARFDEGPYAMVIGAYTIVDFDLREIPPGLIDHREWTRENGRNNALRINGLGAPRAFYVPLLREIAFPNTSYGEDYSVALRLSRHYEIGRIYESLYYARRWEGNSDAALPVGTSNRYDAYKDHLRTVEILARQRMNRA